MNEPTKFKMAAAASLQIQITVAQARFKIFTKFSVWTFVGLLMASSRTRDGDCRLGRMFDLCGGFHSRSAFCLLLYYPFFDAVRLVTGRGSCHIISPAQSVPQLVHC